MNHGLLLTVLSAQPDANATTSPVPAGIDWWSALAGLHPLVLHFPIALIIVAAVIEFLALLGRRERLTSFGITAILIGTPLAILAAWSGWAMADLGYGSGWQLSLHRWFGVASAVLLAGIFVLTLISWFGSKAWATATTRGLLLVAAILIGITAHFGGSMVWGGSLLIESLFPEDQKADVPAKQPAEQPAEQPAAVPSEQPSEKPEAPSTPPQDPAPSAEAPTPEVAKVSFTRDVAPILDTHCWNCHGPTGRAKAGIRLASEADFQRVIGGEPLVAPGAPDKSLLYTVVTVPRDDDLAMPPGGPGLSSSEIDTLSKWITQGASIEPAGETPAPPVPAKPVAAPTESAPAQPPTADATATAAASSPAVRTASTALDQRGVSVRPIAIGSPLLVLNASGLSHRIDPAFGDGDMALVAPLKPVLVEINLSSTAVTDTGVEDLAGFEQLKQVSLKDTRTSDQAARLLSSLPAIESVNFFGTDLGDAGLLDLANAPSLTRVYAGQTRVTESGVASATARRPNLVVVWQAPTLPAESDSSGSDEP